MKTISLLLSGVLFCTLVSAHGTDEFSSTFSSLAVTNASGSSLVKLYYKSIKRGSVKISIEDASGLTVFSETIKKADGFMRPYNFESLPKGQYIVRVEDENGQMVEVGSHSELAKKKGVYARLLKLQQLGEVK